MHLPRLNAVLSIRNRKLHTLITQCYCMKFLNACQKPINTCDQPVYALTKKNTMEIY